MIFDTFCKVVKKWGAPPEIHRALKRFAIFEFPGRSHEILKREWSEYEMNTLRDSSTLPFPYVAVEDTASCVILWDDEPKQVGLFKKRWFAECIDMSVDMKEFSPDRIVNADFSVEEYEKMRNTTNGGVLIVMGNIEYTALTSETEFVAAGSAVVLLVADEDALHYAAVQGQQPIDATPNLHNASTALQELMWFSSPGSFILETTPEVHERIKRKCKGNITGTLRSHERPRYTILHPREIRKRMELSEPSGTGTKRPHERRAHIRVLRDKRYKHNEDGTPKTQTIPATWIGPSESKVGNKRYRVLLDR